VQAQASLAVQAVAVIVQIDQAQVLVLRDRVIMVVPLLAVTIHRAVVVAVRVALAAQRVPEVRAVLVV
jgi:hypothetical protein